MSRFGKTPRNSEESSANKSELYHPGQKGVRGGVVSGTWESLIKKTNFKGLILPPEG
jgi:hypothetical protein